MSVVSNCIFSFSSYEDDGIISEVNSYLLDAGRGEFVSVKAGNTHKIWYGGTKVLETPLFIAAFNWLDEEGFIEHLKTIDWYDPESVQLIIKR